MENNSIKQEKMSLYDSYDKKEYESYYPSRLKEEITYKALVKFINRNQCGNRLKSLLDPVLYLQIEILEIERLFSGKSKREGHNYNERLMRYVNKSKRIDCVLEYL